MTEIKNHKLDKAIKANYSGIFMPLVVTEGGQIDNGDPNPPAPEIDIKINDDGIVDDDDNVLIPNEFFDKLNITTVDGKLTIDGKPISDLNPLLSKYGELKDAPEVEAVEIDGVEYTLDADGNAVDTVGQIRYTKEELAELDKATQVQIGDKVYNLDKDGNAIDEEGKVIMSKEDIDKSLESSPSFGIEDIQKVIGLELKDENGEPVVYEDSITGIASYVNDVVNLQTRQAIIEDRNSLFQQNPILLDILNYQRLHGDLKGYNFEQPDYSKVKIDKDDVAQQKSLIVEAYIKKGNSKEDAERFANYSEKDGTLLKDSEAAKTYLIDNDKATKQQRVEDLKARELERVETERKYYNRVNEIISKGELKLGDESIILPKVFKIPTEDGKIKTLSRESFLDYIGTERQYNVNGQKVNMTAYDYDLMREESTRTVDKDVYDALKVWLRYDDSQLIKAKVNKEEVNRIKKLVTQGNIKKITKPIATKKVRAIDEINTNN